MLHLLPVRWILVVGFAAIGLSVLATVYAGWIGQGEIIHDATLLLRWSFVAATSAIILLFAAWRWVPPIQRVIFPYLGGRWSGFVQFGASASDTVEVKLEIKHTLFGLQLLLESKESISWTLTVHAERAQDFARYRLYYVYLNERKEGFPNPRERYRGLAILRLEEGKRPKLIGNYFTETDRQGTLQLMRNAANPWWTLWR
jgi:SMODS-associating 2TM, beta-strand rich effector domain